MFLLHLTSLLESDQAATIASLHEELQAQHVSISEAMSEIHALSMTRDDNDDDGVANDTTTAAAGGAGTVDAEARAAVAAAEAQTRAVVAAYASLRTRHEALTDRVRTAEAAAAAAPPPTPAEESDGGARSSETMALREELSARTQAISEMEAELTRLRAAYAEVRTVQADALRAASAAAAASTAPPATLPPPDAGVDTDALKADLSARTGAFPCRWHFLFWC